MKTVEQIKDEVAIAKCGVRFSGVFDANLPCIIDECMKLYANQKLDETGIFVERIILTDYTLRIEMIEAIDSLKDKI